VSSFNVRAGTQDRNGMLMYYVSLKPGLYKTFGTQFDAFWCCTGTGSEEYAKLNDSIYFHDADSVYVNLFIPSKLDWKQRGFQLRQTTKFPNEERITFTVDAAPSKPTALKIRVPYWATSGVTVDHQRPARHRRRDAVHLLHPHAPLEGWRRPHRRPAHDPAHQPGARRQASPGRNVWPARPRRPAGN
jgi:DUF1680 family protein